MIKDARRHWDDVYGTKGAENVSWFQLRPDTSLRLLTGVGNPAASVIDVGAGASSLADELLGRGWQDATGTDAARRYLEGMIAHHQH